MVKKKISSLKPANIFSVKSFKNFIKSDIFRILILVAFLMQGLFFAVSMNVGQVGPDLQAYNYGVSPDEFRHIGNIKLYSEKPLLSSPFLKVDNPDLLELGEIERFPNYLYYYIMSFISRGVMLFTDSEAVSVLSLRLVTLLTGLAALMTFWKLALEVTESKGVSNLSVLILANTGMFVWMSSAVNYDIPALLLYFALLLFCVRAFSAPINLLYAMPLAFLVSLTKYTYMPFALLTIGLTFTYILYSGKLRFLTKAIREKRTKERFKTILFLATLIITGTLFLERIGLNYVNYGEANPVCDKVHSVEECRRFDIYERNYTQEKEYKKSVENGNMGPIVYRFPWHVGLWADYYLNSTITYRGHNQEIKELSPIIVFLTPIIVGATFFIYTRRSGIILQTAELKLLTIVALLYLLGTYIFNVLSMLRFGVTYAYQGRYILLSLAIIYINLALLFRQYYYSSLRTRKALHSAFYCMPVVLIFVWMILTNPMVGFYIHVNGLSWYTDYVTNLLPDEILNGF